MTIIELTNIIKKYSLDNKAINDFHYGDVYDLTAMDDIKYPLINMFISSVDNNDNTNAYNINIFYLDRLTNGLENIMDISNAGTIIIPSILNKIEEKENIVVERPFNINIFKERFTDDCAGCFATIKLNTYKSTNCSNY